ncbi:hypothetical protein FRC02_003761 [Tulasnella sp. 418]|nr:hypothetical protein FRC02_003761 [Tulasnella sp. 418]
MPAINVKTQGTTKAAPLSANPSYSVENLPNIAPAPSVESLNDDHRRGLRRLFIGPMPEKVVAPEIVSRKQKCRLDSRSDDDVDVFSADQLPQERVLHYFLRGGGQEKDWDEDAERSIREEIKRKWQESEWYRVWNTDKKNKGAGGNWVGSSFMIGDVLGLGDKRSNDPVLLGSDDGTDRSVPSSSRARLRPPTLHPSTVETFVTAPTQITDRPTSHSQTRDKYSLSDADQGFPDSQRTTFDLNASTSALIHTEAYQNRPDAFDRAISDGIVGLHAVTSTDRQPTLFLVQMAMRGYVLR